MNMTNKLKTFGLALALGPMVALADAETPAAPAPEAAPAPAAAAKAARPPRPKMTDEQRKAMRARREKFMAQRRAEMEAKMLEVVKKYVPEEDRAKALIKDLQEAMMARPRGPKAPKARPPAPKPDAPAPAPAPAK